MSGWGHYWPTHSKSNTAENANIVKTLVLKRGSFQTFVDNISPVAEKVFCAWSDLCAQRLTKQQTYERLEINNTTLTLEDNVSVACVDKAQCTHEMLILMCIMLFAGPPQSCVKCINAKSGTAS